MKKIDNFKLEHFDNGIAVYMNTPDSASGTKVSLRRW